MKRKIISVLLFSLLIMLGSLTPIVRYSRLTRAVNTPPALTFTHHYYSEIYRSENRSIFVYNGSDMKGPLKSSAFKATVECQTKRVFQGVRVWGGLVSWLTQPLDDDIYVFGEVVIKVWMNSTDDVGSRSGYGMGIFEVDEDEDIVWMEYDYRMSGFRKAISSTPKEYTITLNIDHFFKKGHRIGFGVGAGSTRRGWTVNIFFDSHDRKSMAIVPYVEIPAIVIDQAYVSGERVDVGSAQVVGFHAKWHNDSDVVGCKVYVNGTEYVTNGTGWISFTTEAYKTVGKRWWKVTAVSHHNVTSHLIAVEPVSCIWDRVKIVDGGVTSTQTNIEQKETVWFRAVYEYDNAVFNGSRGTLYVNGSNMTWNATNNRWEREYAFNTPGTRTFEVSSVSDDLYGLKSINDTVGELSITWSQTVGVSNATWVLILVISSVIGVGIFLLLRKRLFILRH